MKYKGFRFKGIVKEQFRKQFESIALYGQWDELEDPVISSFAKDRGAHYIPHGTLNNMPDSWNSWVDNNSAIAKSYNVNTGYWTFQCSLPYVFDAVERFLEIAPHFIDSVEYCEVFQEDWSCSRRYELVDNVMKMMGEGYRRTDGEGLYFNEGIICIATENTPKEQILSFHQIKGMIVSSLLKRIVEDFSREYPHLNLVVTDENYLLLAERYYDSSFIRGSIVYMLTFADGEVAVKCKGYY